MSEIRVATRYAKSLFDLAVERDILDRVVEDASAFVTAVHENRGFSHMLTSPIISEDKKSKVIKEIFGSKFDDITNEFIKIVIRKRREMLLGKIFDQFIEMYREQKGILKASVTTAVPLGKSILKDIQEYLKDQTGKDVELQPKVDPAIMGGFVIRYEDKLLDSSVAGQLKNIRKHLLINN